MGILQFRVVAENIAYNQGYEDPGAFAVERWMLSLKHPINILSSNSVPWRLVPSLRLMERYT